MNINGQTKLIGFFGTTYKTSKMYGMYNAAIEALGLNCIYLPFAVDDLQKATEGIRHLGVAAIGITIPYKTDIMPFLDELDADAVRIGAVNVVVNRDGRLIGSNTDGQGALRALREQAEPAGREVLLLGAGGAARAIAFALADAGAKLTILNRTVAKAQELAEAVGNRTRFGGVDDLPPSCDILLNTTSYGMANTPEVGLSLIPPSFLRAEMTVMDIVSNPRETRLLQDAATVGCKLVYGYRMLLWQGVYKFELFTGVEPPIDVMEAAMESMK